MTETITDPCVRRILAHLLAQSPLWTAPDFPFKAYVESGHEKLLVVTGPNGSGKSLLVEALRACSRKFIDKSLTIQVSMRERTGGGNHPEAGMRRMAMFGDESTQSTGAASVGVLRRAIHNHTDYCGNAPTLLVLDEPDLGLSDGYARALGEMIRNAVMAQHERSLGIVVVTHSKALVDGLRTGLGQDPTFASLGSPMTIDVWMTSNDQRSIADLEELSAACSQNRNRVREIQDRLR